MNPFVRLREIAQVFGLAGGESEETWFDSSNPFCREAERLLRAGRAAEAEEIFARVLREPQYAAVVRRQHPRILLALCEARLQQKKWDEARDAALQARAMLSDSRLKGTREFADCCRCLGQSALGKGSKEEAVRYFLEGIAAFEILKSPNPAGLVARRLEAAALLRELGRTEQAEHQAREAARVAAQRLAGRKEEGDALIELAQCLAAAGYFQEARETGERAVAIHRAACGEFSGEVAEDYEKLGGICQKQQDYQAAVAYLEKALGVRDRQVGGDTSQLGVLLVALADLYTILGRLAPALELLQQAVGKLTPSRDANLADALEKLGAMYVRTGRYEDAADCYRRACDVWAASPELFADRLEADVRALEELKPLLPEPEAPFRPAAPDPGTPILLDRQAAAPGRAIACPGSPQQAAPGASAAWMPQSEATGYPEGHGAGPRTGQPWTSSHAFGVPSGVVIPKGHVASEPPPQGLAAGVPPHPWPVASAGPGSGGAASAGTGPVGGHTGGGPARPESAISRHPAVLPGHGGGSSEDRVRGALAAMDAAMASRQAGQALWGWEELDFEPLRQ